MNMYACGQKSLGSYIFKQPNATFVQKKKKQ